MCQSITPDEASASSVTREEEPAAAADADGGATRSVASRHVFIIITCSSSRVHHQGSRGPACVGVFALLLCLMPCVCMRAPVSACARVYVCVCVPHAPAGPSASASRSATSASEKGERSSACTLREASKGQKRSDKESKGRKQTEPKA
jgi:hypothetical protein